LGLAKGAEIQENLAIGKETIGGNTMQQIQLNDQLYREAQRRASIAGFITVDEYVADVLQSDLLEETENFENLFTRERLAHIDRAAAQIDAGQGIPAEQVRDHFRRKQHNT
jgi:hypothetical protein